MLLHATAGQRIVVGMAPAGKEEPRKPMNGSSGLPLVTGYVLFSCRLRSTAVSWLLQILVRQQICGWWSWGPGTGDFNDRIAVQHIKIVVITNSTVFWVDVDCCFYFTLFFITRAYPSLQNKRRQSIFEHVIFKAEWSVDYFVIKLYGKAFCLLCNDMPNCAERI